MNAPTVANLPTHPPGLLRRLVLGALNSTYHLPALVIYLAIVTGHVSEHAVQAVQVFLLDWDRPSAGGILGVLLQGAAQNEILHVTYNTLQLTGLILLAPGFRAYRAAWRWWIVALVAQTWHWFEHALLIVQFATGIYLYGAIKQMSVLERFIPRIELHLAYNLLAVIPTAIAVVLYLRQRAGNEDPSSRKRAPV